MRKKITPEMKTEIMAKIAKGESLPNLATVYGIGAGTLYSWKYKAKKIAKDAPIVFKTKSKPKANRKTYPTKDKTTDQLKRDLTEANFKIAELKEERDLFRKLSFRLLKTNGA